MLASRIIAIQADSIELLNLKSDTSLFIASEVTLRDYRVFFYKPCDLYLTNEGCYANGQFVEVDYQNFTSSFNIISKELLRLNDVDAILIRQDPPFNMDYLHSTYLLEQLLPDVVIINHPVGIRNNVEKLIPFHFKEFIPPTLVISSLESCIYDFIRYHEKVILKPLYWFGGQYVKLLSSNDLKQGISEIKNMIEQHQHVVIQKFLPEVVDGDKRIILIDGKIAGAIVRVPENGGFVSNLAAGGTAAATYITSKEQLICEHVGEYLQSQGIILAGIDLINGHLIEVNITSPTGLVAINSIYGLNLAVEFVDYIEKRILSN